MGSSSSRIGSDPSSESSRMNRTKRKLSSLLLCGLTTNSSSHSSVLELESPINSIENIPPTSVDSITSERVSSFFGSEPACTSSKTSETEPDDSESQPIQESISGNYGSDPVSTFDPQSAMNEERMPVSSPDDIIQETLDFDENSRQNQSDTRALLVLSDSILTLRMFGNGLTTSRSGGVSVINSREERRNSGRLLGATSSRRTGGDFPAIVLTSGRVDDLGSRDRWLLDISGDLGRDGRRHGYSRSNDRNEERINFRSQMSERGLGGSSFMGEDAGFIGSISRVVLLAQALSEVLDEIHRQPLSLSMPMLSLPAPESIVDSFLLKSHKMNVSEIGPNYVQQCYICLVDYEEGDKIRVLPCQHEYHAPCVDKWLKEVNGVCPVCRCNVCEAPVSSSELAA